MNCHDRNPVQEKHDEHEHNRYGENHDAGTWRTTDEGQANARQEDQLKSTTGFFGGNLDRHIAFQAWIMCAMHRSHAAFTDGRENFAWAEFVACREPI